MANLGIEILISNFEFRQNLFEKGLCRFKTIGSSFYFLSLKSPFYPGNFSRAAELF